MAKRPNAHPDNAPGSYFVDRACIDCGTCYDYAPEIFADAGDHAVVHRQPEGDALRRKAAQALVACPVAAIGTEDKAFLRAAATDFPVPLEDEVAYCGYASERSFGGRSWFIQRPGGNVLFDSPRAAPPLLQRLDALGGIKWMVLSHRDDVADHQAIQANFGCRRVMHRDDGLRGLEHYVTGSDPVPLEEDLLLIPTPGHSPGSLCLLYRNRFLFTGDHLWWNPTAGRLSASKTYCWHDWPTQLRSLEKLLAFDFTWVLPGHGAWYRADSPEAMKAELQRALGALRG